MDLEILFIDHHQSPDTRISEYENVSVLRAGSGAELFERVRDQLVTPCQLLLSETNLDGILAAAILGSTTSPRPAYRCIDAPLNARDFQKLARQGTRRIVAFHSQLLYESELDAVWNVLWCNPSESGLEDMCAAQIVYGALEAPTEYHRDLAGLGIVADYNIEEAYETIVDVIRNHEELFPDLVRRARDETLDKFALRDSPFQQILRMFWAPIILKDTKGAEELVEALLAHPDFSYDDLLGGSDNQAVQYLHKQYTRYQDILREEEARFAREAHRAGRIITYAPKHRSVNFVRDFANVIKDQHRDAVIVMKVKQDRRHTKYSLRRGDLDVDLGAICRALATGGGNPYAAGAVVENEAVFEQELREEIARYRLKATK